MKSIAAELIPRLITGVKLGLFFTAVWFSSLVIPSDARADWSFSNSGVSNDLNGVYFIDTSTGWAIGNGGTILKTVNAGGSWSAQTSGVATNLQKIQFDGPSSSTGIIVGSNGLILRTTDAMTWQSMDNQGDSNSLFGVSWMASTGVVWAVGAAGTVRKSTDSGAFWSNGDQGGNIPAAQNLRAVFFMNWSTGIVAGDAGTLYRTVNGGANWTDISTGATQNLRDVFFVDPSTGFIVGDGGTVRKSTDAGSFWFAVAGGTHSLNAVHFVSTQTGWAAGASGSVITSTNNGSTFNYDASSMSVAVNDLYFLSTDLGFAVGASGSITKYRSASSIVGGSTSSSETVTQQGSLTPLNNLIDPTKGDRTTIRYYFKTSGRVTIKVYTMQGRLIKTLLSDARDAGVYEDVFWDGKNEDGSVVASGIYLVHIEAPNFSSSRKIAVLK